MQKKGSSIVHDGTMAAASIVWKGNSSSRMAMTCAQIAQGVVPSKSTPSRIQHGYETQLANHTFGTVVKENMVVEAIIQKYRYRQGDKLAVRSNPLLTIIYQSLETGEYGSFHIESHLNQIDRVHETFGFKFEPTELLLNLSPKQVLEKGDVLTHSPNVKDGVYCNGISVPAIYLDLHGTIEDGFIVARSLLEDMSPIATASRIAEYGKRHYPVNLYGSLTEYKPFPGIGDRIRDDGLVFALRSFDENFDFIELSATELLKPDLMHDRLVYGEPGAEVYDITVHTTTNESNSKYWSRNSNVNKNTHTPAGMDVTSEYFNDLHMDYYDTIIRQYEKIKRESRGDFVLTKEFQNLVATAFGQKPNVNVRRFDTRNPQKSMIRKTFKATPIDEWRVEVHYSYRFEADLGAKITNLHGG